MKKINKKGFTMVELLASVAILGILSAIAIVSVSTILNSVDKKHYETQQKNMIVAAKSYTQENRNALPKRIGDTRVIELQDLQRRKYIGDVVDRSKNKCTEGSVTIFKYAKNDYSYSAYLKCGDKEFGINPEDGIPGPKVDLSAEGNFKNPYFTYEINSVDASGNNNGKIVSYDYQIYSSSVLVKDSGSISVSKASSIEKKTVSLKEHVPGSLTIVFTAVNEYGGTTKIKIEKSYQDPDGPICGPQTPERTSWDSASEVTISILCYPREDGSPCAREVFTQHFSAEAEKNYIIISNEAGHKTKCDINTYIDRTPPTKPTIVSTEGFSEGTWRNKNFTLTVTSEDNHSGIAYYQYCYPGVDGVCEESEWVTYNSSIRNIVDLETGEFVYETTAFSRERSEKVAIRAVDQAGNKSASALYQINIDKTAPVVSNISFDTSSRKITAQLSDSASLVSYYGLTTSTVKPSSYTNITDVATYNLSYEVAPAFSGTYYVWAKDAAGNISDGTTSNISITPHSYAITFNANGGTGAPSSQEKIHGVALTLSSTVPTREGYAFLGWSTSSTATSGTYEAGGSYTANAAATLYAVWVMDNPLNSYKCANVSVGSAPYVLEYTGNCTAIDDGSGNWRFKFLTSGTLKTSVNYLLDVFLVGGGGGGGKVNENYGAGGGGGYTNTSFAKIKRNTEYTITIGSGGTYETAGEATSAFGASAAGGGGAHNFAGGHGGSGGAGGATGSGKGGSDGSNGGGSSVAQGIGQGTTTREFGESSGTIYAGGGGSGYNSGSNGAGGAGGGGAGGHNKKGVNGTANTGGGGGGGGYSNYAGGTGGSGIVVIRNTRSSSTASLPGVGFEFTYTGSYSVIDDGSGNWRIKFLTSGTFKSSKDLLVDTFLVGGGGGGGRVNENYGAGGGGGYTTTSFAKIKKNVEYPVVIGSGGGSEANGTESKGFGSIAHGGQGAYNYTGGTGGSGGAGGAVSSGTGGSDGSNGGGSGNGIGIGQGTTTREFGEAGGKLYAGGGGSGYHSGSATNGGAGGGGNGGHSSYGGNAPTNTGGGGGGGGSSDYAGGTGGSGIVIIRNTRNAVTSTLPGVGFDFTYTGSYAIVNEGSGNWKMKFLTSGDFKSTSDLLVDTFLVGGGGGGGQVNENYGAGGGGGYTTTSFAKIKAGVVYPIVIGAGGGNEANGSASTGFGSIAHGGQGAYNYTGGTGGSGGAGGAVNYGVGGSDGGNGGGSGNGMGVGQGTTTREFGETSGKLYSGGGGSGYKNGTNQNYGAGGGGNGGHNCKGVAGVANTGGGGGGGGYSGYAGGTGGSGIVIIRNTRSNSTANLPGVGFDFTYTGSYAIVDEGTGNWKMKFLTSGDFKSNSDLLVDAFLVGGGGGGGKVNENYGAGGGGGYTTTSFAKIKAGVVYPIVIGSGGGNEANGSASTGFGSIAHGGQGAYNYTGGTGGSGGAGGATSLGNGGKDGGNGGGSGNGRGMGQGSTTREFGESSGKLYSGGGGSGYKNGTNQNYGAGGGGNGGHNCKGVAGVANTGGGGGGGGYSDYAGGNGGSGIVIIRNTRNAVTSTLPGVGFDFTYTGSYAIVNEGSGNWKIKFLTSGDFKSTSDLLVDTFLVGGGGGGGQVNENYGAGGGGGYTTTSFAKIKAGVVYPIVIGAGGASETNGGTSKGFGSQAVGGSGAVNYTGGSGGSGGAGGAVNYGVGGSNGSPGGAAGNGSGVGQEETTYEFGEIGGKLYSGGGGSGYKNGTNENGGAGGGGNGGHIGKGTEAVANTGGGGGGGGYSGYAGGTGGSGIVIIRNTRSNSTANLPSVGFDFTYTGSYSIVNDGSGHWRLKFLTSGTFNSKRTLNVNVFLVGGGGGGGQVNENYGAGGGGGYTKTASVSITANKDYAIVVGSGGASENDGTASTGFGLTAAGGKKASNYNGGTGGSGGAGGAVNYGVGGSNGGNGGGSSTYIGTGQGTTTREFGESTGKLYSGGGGSGYKNGSNQNRGTGGGGNGGHIGIGTPGSVNTGGGGGGGGYSGYAGGNGGSGIVIIRDAR